MANVIKVKKGDLIKIVGRHCGHNFKIGEIVTVNRVGDYDINAINEQGTTWYLHHAEYVPYNEPFYREGDKAITNGENICGHGFRKGTVVTVKKVGANGRVDYVEDANGRGFFVENEEIEPYTAPRTNGFKLGDVIYLVHVDTFMHLTAESTLKLANESSATAVRIATEDERRKHLGLPPVKKPTDLIEVKFTVTRKDLEEAVEHLGKHNRGYNTYHELDNALGNDEY